MPDPQSARWKVFLVEDDEDDYILTREFLAETQKGGFHLDWVPTYEAGLEAMRAQQHDVYLVDYRLGKDSGLQLLREAVAAGCLAPIILLTGLGDSEVDSDAMKAGAADYLVKGQFDAHLLERSIRHSILRKRTERDLHQQLTRIRLLNEIAHAISERQDLPSILNVVLAQLEAHLPIDLGGVYLFEPQTSTLRLAAIQAKDRSIGGPDSVRREDRVGLPTTGLESCAAGETLHVVGAAGSSSPILGHFAGRGMESLVAVPLMVERSLFGILVAGRREGREFGPGELVFLQALSEHVALAARQAQLHMELQRAYDELRQTQQAVMQHERLRALGQLASGIAHDINNTLSPISGYAELLLRHEPDLSDRAQKYLQHIKTASDDVAHIVTRMRDFYRKREENQPLLPVDVNQLVQQVIDLTRPRWRDVSQQRGIPVDIELALDPRLPAVIGTESELREALTNLIFNAVDAMPSGGVITLRTRAGAWPAGRGGSTPLSQVIIEVTDTGVGMDEETRKRCLEPFFSTKGQRGTGLGLAMVYGVVQRHEGVIEIESVPGKGTTFRLVLPVRETRRPDAVDTSGVSPKIPPLRILFVDDEPLLRELLREVLETDGHQVSVADGGEAALTLFRAAMQEGVPFDAVITDLGMPHLDGRRLAQILKSESPTTPVIMMTGWGSLMKEDGEKPAHVDGMLNKPPKIRELQEALRQVTPVRSSPGGKARPDRSRR